MYNAMQCHPTASLLNYHVVWQRYICAVPLARKHYLPVGHFYASKVRNHVYRMHINFAQKLINQPFQGSTRNALLDHWIVAASHKAKVVHVYDSAFSSLDQTSAATVQNLFRCSLINISMVPTQKQLGGSDCGLFAIANATAIAFGRDPSKELYQQSLK